MTLRYIRDYYGVPYVGHYHPTWEMDYDDDE